MVFDSGVIMLALGAFVGVAAMVGGAAMMLRPKTAEKVEERLDIFTGAKSIDPQAKMGGQNSGVLAQPLDSVPGLFETFMERFGNVGVIFEQADTSLTISRFAAICLALAVLGAVAGSFIGIHTALLPVVGITMGCVPVAWLVFRRKRRLKQFAIQLPDAMEMMARSLRAGQSLGMGFQLVASEMAAPIGQEFGRVYEEQNLGIPLEETLDDLANRIPNLDLRFFVIAVILQRQTGGDMAEILDKIGNLVRQRFQIWGQVQALTGEGRLSGIVLLALPFLLFLAVYQLNPDYVMLLFDDPIGKKMLAVALVMQVVGALVIKKIVNIKV